MLLSFCVVVVVIIPAVVVVLVDFILFVSVVVVDVVAAEYKLSNIKMLGTFLGERNQH